MNKPAISGLTSLEVLIVLAAVMVLVAIVLSQLRESAQHARRITCTN